MVEMATGAREATEAGEYAGQRRGQEVLLTGATAKLGPCQVRSKTKHPCPNQAVMKFWGISFCEPCAREQEAYFAIGKLTMQPQALAFDRELAARIAEAGKC
jgi:hypothetical protein